MGLNYLRSVESYLEHARTCSGYGYTTDNYFNTFTHTIGYTFDPGTRLASRTESKRADPRAVCPFSSRLKISNHSDVMVYTHIIVGT